MSQPKIRANQLYNVQDSTVNGDTVKAAVDEFKSFPTGQASPIAGQFRANSLSGFDAVTSTDFPGSYYTGVTVMGPLERGCQIAINWNAEEGRPYNMYVRTHDEQLGGGAWGAWNKVDVGESIFGNSPASPSGGVPGDYVYEITQPKMWANDAGTWRPLTKIFAQDSTGTWRDVQQKWVNQSGLWVQVFGPINNALPNTPLFAGYFTDFGTTWYSDAPDGTTNPQPLGEHVYTTVVSNDTASNLSVHLYGGVDDSLTFVKVNGVNVLTGPQMGFGSPAASTNFALVPGINYVTISINNSNTYHAFALKLRRTSDNFVLCDIDDWRIGQP